MTSSLHAGYQHPAIDGRHFLYGVGERPRTLCELAMMRLSAELRARKDWWLLYRDEETLNKWAEEAMNKTWSVRTVSNNFRIGLGRHQINYVLSELDEYATLRDSVTGIQVSCFDRIWESDQLRSADECETMLSLIEEYRATQNLIDPEAVVDPFSHAYIWTRTFLPFSQDYSLLEATRSLELDQQSTRIFFESIPTPVRIMGCPNRAAYLSYINGLNPDFSELYAALQSTLGRCIPMFERTLTSLHRSNPLPQRIRGTYRYRVWDEPDPPEDSDEEAWSAHWREVQQWSLNRPIEIPDIPEDGYSRGSLRFNHHVEFELGRQIQVIHRITYSELDASKPMTPKTKWHIEGTKRERIVACCLHFVSVEGVDDVNIEFRMATTSPSDFMPHDVGATLRTWGLQNGDECNQHIGSVRLRTGLTIAFPNIYQHRFSEISLKKGFESGRIVVVEFYLVDPDLPPIPSTADIAPQQRDWIYRALDRSLDSRLPPEVLERVLRHVESVLTDEEVKKYRNDMFAARDMFRRQNDDMYFCLPFNVGD